MLMSLIYMRLGSALRLMHEAATAKITTSRMTRGNTVLGKDNVMTTAKRPGAPNMQPIVGAPMSPSAPTRRKPGPKPGTEAAKRGGMAARQKYGLEFYSRIGKKGGTTVSQRHGSDYYTEIGRRGGESTKRTLGVEHYSRIGKIGSRSMHSRRRKSLGEE